MRYVTLEAQGAQASGKSLLLDFLIRNLKRVGIDAVYVKGHVEHRILVEIPDDKLMALWHQPKDGEVIDGMATMRLNAEEVRLIEDHRLSKLY